MLREHAGCLPARLEVNAQGTYSRTRVERYRRWLGAAFGLCLAFFKDGGVRGDQAQSPCDQMDPHSGRTQLSKGSDKSCCVISQAPLPELQFKGAEVGPAVSIAVYHEHACGSERQTLQRTPCRRKPFTTFLSIPSLYLPDLNLS